MQRFGMAVATTTSLSFNTSTCLQIIKDLQLLVMVVVLVLADAVLLFTWVFSDPIQCFRSLSVSLRVMGWYSAVPCPVRALLAKLASG